MSKIFFIVGVLWLVVTVLSVAHGDEWLKDFIIMLLFFMASGYEKQSEK